MLFRKTPEKRSDADSQVNCDCGKTVSAIPIVNQILHADELELMALQIELEYMTPEEIHKAFALDMSEDKYVDISWQNSWKSIGDSLRCAMRKKLDILPEADRGRIEQMLNQ